LKNNTTLILSVVLALVLASGITLRVISERQDFNLTVRTALKTSAGYDEQFISIVNRLEKELANRASFGYQGGKDPMTGRVRSVVLPVQMAASSAAPVPDRKADTARPKPRDPVKLTAIIHDEKNNRFTAIVMDGERSYSLEVGDRVRSRAIRKITAEVIVMEDDTLFYQYDIFGKCVTKRKY
jgi:hypothetical protein